MGPTAISTPTSTVNRHGVAGLATVLSYAVARERSEVTHRLMARDLEISPLADIEGIDDA
ncbi:transcriptional regulator, TrmB [Halogranum salarium B-1]|uniref:Transcriptional regulator, TrmB n=1 Tax=Halogranum salarium B-1 TaxID=1210908 RepID=J3JDA1_9EURY|nr:transcriptional regulator, TrmB [Halogranum salarium B-1]